MNKLKIILLVIVVYGCKVNKEKQKSLWVDTQNQVAVRGDNAAWQFKGQDSSYRYLSFVGDSAFFFHPDIGLWSRAGKISYVEQRAIQQQTSEISVNYDSIRTENIKSASQTNSKKSRYPVSNGLWLLAIIPIVALIYWCWRKV